MGKKYLNRVNALVHRKLMQLLLEETNDPRLTEVSITGVSVNRDTTRAEVFYSIIGSEEEIVEIQSVLDKAAGWLRRQLAPSLRLRNIPQLVFVYDPSLAQGDRIDALLQELGHDDVAMSEDSLEV